jgi:hypothetical protein
MEYIAQLVRYSRTCCSYQEWLDRELWITRNYWTKWFVVIMFNLRLWQFYDRHHDLINRYGLCHRWPLICCVRNVKFKYRSSFLSFSPTWSLLYTYQHVDEKGSTVGRYRNVDGGLRNASINLSKYSQSKLTCWRCTFHLESVFYFIIYKMCPFLKQTFIYTSVILLFFGETKLI